MNTPTRIAALLAATTLGLGCGPGSTSNEDLCATRLPGDLVISELMTDPEGTDDGKEYIELFNASGEELDLKGFTLLNAAVDGTAEKKHNFASVKIPAGGYLAAGDSEANPLPAWLGYTYKNALGSLRNTGGKVTIRCGTKVIDQVVYKTASKAGKARELNGALVPDSANNDVEENFCPATAQYDGVNFGSPGQPNSKCGGAVGGTTCLDAQTHQPRQVLVPAPGDLVITELMPDPSAVPDADGEWVELTATKKVDLNGLVVQAGSGKTTLNSESCLSVAPGEFAILARKAESEANGGLPFVTATLSVNLTNSAGSLSIVRADETLIDAVAWTKSTAGVSLQLDGTKTDATSNDDEANFCAAEQTYGAGDKGTPGAANRACAPVVVSDTCTDPVSGTTRMIVKPAVGQLVITEIMANPDAVNDDKGEWVEVLSRADVDLNGVAFVGDSGTTTLLNNATCLRLAAGRYGVFARNLDPAVNGGLPEQSVIAALGSINLANTGTAAAPRSIALMADTVELDKVTWTASTAGASTQLSANRLDAVSNDDPASFCVTPQGTTYGAGNRGTPGSDNLTCG